jgi:hypothetical protein
VPIYRGPDKLEAITRAKGILQAIRDAASSSRLSMSCCQLPALSGNERLLSQFAFFDQSDVRQSSLAFLILMPLDYAMDIPGVAVYSLLFAGLAWR